MKQHFSRMIAVAARLVRKQIEEPSAMKGSSSLIVWLLFLPLVVPDRLLLLCQDIIGIFDDYSVVNRQRRCHHLACAERNYQAASRALDDVETKMENMPTRETVKPQLTEEQQRSERQRTTLRFVVIGIGLVCLYLLGYVIYSVYSLLV